ncbi:MAG: helix-turn-helix domain-containing protein [Saprospiraceae bacterium]
MLNHFENISFSLTSSTNWLDRLDDLLQTNPQCYNYNNQQLARLMCVSERQLFRKFKSQTSMSPKQYLRQCRLEKAKKYLAKGDYQTVNELAYSVGYENVGYFINQFKQLYGQRPLEALKEHGWR